MTLSVTLAICIWATVFLISIGYTGASPQKRTIDDKFGDNSTGTNPIFHPTTGGIWKETCPHPNPKCQATGPDTTSPPFMGTWQAAISKPDMPKGPISIDLTFQGTAINLHFITEGPGVVEEPRAITSADCHFTLDGQPKDFSHKQTTRTDYTILVFWGGNLSNQNHNLTVTFWGHEGNQNAVLVNFDYAKYTFDDDPTDPTSPPISTTLTPSTTPVPLSSKNTSIKSPENPWSSPSSPGDPSKPTGTLTPQMTPSTATEKPPLNPQSSPPASTMISTPEDSGKKAPVGSIIGGTIGGLALIIIIVFLLRLQCYRKKQQRGMASTPAALFSAQNPSLLERIRHRDLRFLPNHDSISFKPHNGFKYGNYDAEPPHHPSGSYVSDESDYTYASREKFGYTGKQAD